MLLSSDTYRNRVIDLMNTNDLITRKLTMEGNEIKERYSIPAAF